MWDDEPSPPPAERLPGRRPPAGWRHDDPFADDAMPEAWTDDPFLGAAGGEYAGTEYARAEGAGGEYTGGEYTGGEYTGGEYASVEGAMVEGTGTAGPRTARGKVLLLVVVTVVFLGTLLLCCVAIGQAARLLEVDPTRL